MLSWLGLVGAWLLVAGSIFQAMLELRDYDRIRDRIGTCAREVAMPRIPIWWWLVPPVYYVKSRRRSKRLFVEVLARLSPAEIRGFVDLFDKTVGWSFVAGGGLLLAGKETLVIAGNFHVARGLAFVAVAFFLVVCVAVAKLRLVRSQAMAKSHVTPETLDR